MKWNPNKWIAILLAFFNQPLGMLYVVRVKLAVIYLIVAIVAAATDFWLQVQQVEWAQYIYFSLIVTVVCMAHIYKIVKGCEGIKNRPWFSRWYGLSILLMTMFFVVFLLRSFLFEPFQMPSRSMIPTLDIGDVAVASKWGYGNYGTFGVSLAKARLSKQLDRGDIVIFEYPPDPKTIYIKRIIGLPDDSIIYQNDTLFINGNKIHRELVRSEGGFEIFKENIEQVNYELAFDPARPSQNIEVIVPSNHLFVLGDNRDNSNDSRYWGFVPLKNIVGKVDYILQPERRIQ